MEENRKLPEFMFIELRDQIGNALRVDYDDELITDLIENNGWLETIKGLDDGREQHYLFPSTANVIRHINWIE